MTTKRLFARQNQHMRRGYAFLTGVSVAALLAFFPAGARAQLRVEQGWDLLTTTDGAFFDFGGGPVPLVGVPYVNFDFTTGTGGDFGRGIDIQFVSSTDTIVKRLAPAVVPSVPNDATINIEMVGLQLKTAVPIDIGAGLHVYFVTLQSQRTAAEGGPGTPSQGTMTITFNNTAGQPPTQPVDGTFTSDWLLHLDFREDSLDGTIGNSMDLPLSSSGTNWSHFPNTDTFLIDGVNNKLNGTDQLGDFHIVGAITPEHPNGDGIVIEEKGAFGRHPARETIAPEPGALAFVALGLLAGVIRRRRHG